jgi:hypothetical protein
MIERILYRLHRIFNRFPGCPPSEDLFEFTLDGMPAAQQEKVRKHLSRCFACREQVKDFAWVSEGIALSAPQVDPPSNLCDKVKARIQDDPEGGHPSPTAPNVVQQSVAEPQDPLAGWPRFWMRMGPVFALASLLMTMVAMVALIAKSPAPSSPEQTLLASQHQELELEGQGAGAGASARIAFREGEGVVWMKVAQLRPCPKGRLYTLWARDASGKFCRVAGFHTESSGDSSYFLKLDKPLSLGKGDLTFEVTAEAPAPVPASAQGEVYLRGRVKL